MENCVFCKIIAKEIPAAAVYEDEAALGILDLHPRTIGHAIILPKKHYANILEVPPGELGPLWIAVQKTAAAVAKALRPDGFTIGVNHGEVAGQSVPHLHIHILPRFRNDAGGSIHSVVDNPPAEDLEDVRRKIMEGFKK